MRNIFLPSILDDNKNVNSLLLLKDEEMSKLKENIDDMRKGLKKYMLKKSMYKTITTRIYFENFKKKVNQCVVSHIHSRIRSQKVMDYDWPTKDKYYVGVKEYISEEGTSSKGEQYRITSEFGDL